MGHVIALRREGIPASAPMFIPFLGAVITAKSLGENALAEARVGLAGPILGSLGAAAVALAGALTGSALLQALAYTGFLLNLFNLLPVVPLDGGRAMAAMAPWMWFLGFAALVALFFLAPNGILLIIIFFGGLETWRRWKQRRSRTLEQAAYYRVSPRNRLIVGAVYLGLIGRPRPRHGGHLRPALDRLHPLLTPRAAARGTPPADARSDADARCISRSESRFFIDSRLSWTSLPRASAISTFARGPEK